MKKNIEKFSVGKKKFFQKIEIDRVGTLERVLDAAKDIPRFPGLYPSKREKKLKAKDPNYRFEGTRYLEMHRLKKKTEQQLKEQMKTKALQKKVSMLVKQPSKESNQVTKSEIDQKINSILSDFLQGETKSKKKNKKLKGNHQVKNKQQINNKDTRIISNVKQEVKEVEKTKNVVLKGEKKKDESLTLLKQKNLKKVVEPEPLRKVNKKVALSVEKNKVLNGELMKVKVGIRSVDKKQTNVKRVGVKKLKFTQKYNSKYRSNYFRYGKRRYIKGKYRRGIYWLRQRRIWRYNKEGLIILNTNKLKVVRVIRPYLPWGLIFSRKLGKNFPKNRRFKRLKFKKILKYLQIAPEYKVTRFMRNLGRTLVVNKRNFFHYRMYRRAQTRYFTLKNQLYVRESFFKRLYFQYYIGLIRPSKWWRRYWYLRGGDLKEWFVPKQLALLGRAFFLREVHDKSWYRKKCLGSQLLTERQLFAKGYRIKELDKKWRRWGKVKRNKRRVRKPFYGITILSTSNNVFLTFYRMGFKQRKLIIVTSVGQIGIQGQIKSSIPAAQDVAKLFCRKVFTFFRVKKLGKIYRCRIFVKTYFSKKLKLLLREIVKSRLRIKSILFRRIKAHNGCRPAKARRK